MRSIAKLMKDWQFTGPNGVTTAVELPHTWNARDGQDGGNDYWRGCCTYCTRFAAPVYDPAQQQVWLQFEGVNTSAAVLLNGQQLCTHDGGYSTFRAEVTELLQAENQLTVRVDNSVNDRVYPQKADFTFYGGIYRDVSLLVVNKNHIALGHFGDTGVKITPALQENSADIRVETLVEGSGTVTVELLDAEGKPVGTGMTGEICIKTSDKVPCGLFQGYLNNPEKTAEVWHDGWYHTGDVAWKDEDGFFWYVGRVDDVIKSSGYRIGPFEVESVIMELPYVLECGVSAVPDETRGQVVKASIVLTKGTEPTEALKKEIQTYVKEHTAPYKYPRVVVFKESLPKTISGKIQRNLL